MRKPSRSKSKNIPKRLRRKLPKYDQGSEYQDPGQTMGGTGEVRSGDEMVFGAGDTGGGFNFMDIVQFESDDEGWGFNIGGDSSGGKYGKDYYSDAFEEANIIQESLSSGRYPDEDLVQRNTFGELAPAAWGGIMPKYWDGGVAHTGETTQEGYTSAEGSGFRHFAKQGRNPRRDRDVSFMRADKSPYGPLRGNRFSGYDLKQENVNTPRYVPGEYGVTTALGSRGYDRGVKKFERKTRRRPDRWREDDPYNTQASWIQRQNLGKDLRGSDYGQYGNPHPASVWRAYGGVGSPDFEGEDKEILVGGSNIKFYDPNSKGVNESSKAVQIDGETHPNGGSLVGTDAPLVVLSDRLGPLGPLEKGEKSIAALGEPFAKTLSVLEKKEKDGEILDRHEKSAMAHASNALDSLAQRNKEIVEGREAMEAMGAMEAEARWGGMRKMPEGGGFPRPEDYSLSPYVEQTYPLGADPRLFNPDYFATGPTRRPFPYSTFENPRKVPRAPADEFTMPTKMDLDPGWEARQEWSDLDRYEKYAEEAGIDYSTPGLIPDEESSKGIKYRDKDRGSLIGNIAQGAAAAIPAIASMFAKPREEKGYLSTAQLSGKPLKGKFRRTGFTPVGRSIPLMNFESRMKNLGDLEAERAFVLGKYNAELPMVQALNAQRLQQDLYNVGAAERADRLTGQNIDRIREEQVEAPADALGQVGRILNAREQNWGPYGTYQMANQMSPYYHYDNEGNLLYKGKPV